MIDFNKSRILLEPNEIPKEWVNILPDLPVPMTPLINPMDGKPAPPELAFAIFPKECVLQEISQDPLIHPERIKGALCKILPPHTSS